MKDELLIIALTSCLRTEARLLAVYKHLNLSQAQKLEIQKNYELNLETLIASFPEPLPATLLQALKKNHPDIF
jgi:hypothetical protein